tara:strand:+ start:1536 stop:2162 length:627 start_codon:yes stop_codon:yes gene_type:complete
MPLQVSKSFFKNINLSIWSIEESEDFFISQINLTENCKKRLELIKSPQKRKQFLSVRSLIKLNDIQLKDLYYNEFGAPQLKSNKYISISHTNNYSAIAISNNPVGVDIEHFKDKIKKIKHKFISNAETKLIDINSVRDLTVVWSIKESIYKLYKKQGLSFKNNIKIKSISDDFKNCSVLVEDLEKNSFFNSENIIHSDYICSIVKQDE